MKRSYYLLILVFLLLIPMVTGVTTIYSVRDKTSDFLVFLSSIDMGGKNITDVGSLCLSDDCRDVWPSDGNLTEEDVETYVNNTPNDYFQIKSNETRYIDCSGIYGGSDSDFCSDATDGGAGMWLDQGTYLEPDPTYANDVRVSGTFETNNITNPTRDVSIIIDEDGVVVKLG